MASSAQCVNCVSVVCVGLYVRKISSQEQTSVVVIYYLLCVQCLFVCLQTSDFWNKRHSVAIGDVHECKLIRRKEITPKQVEHIWKSMTIAQYVTFL